MSTAAPGANAAPPPLAAAARRGAEFLEPYCQAAIRIAGAIVVVASLVSMIALAANVFARNIAGFSYFGSEELARFAFLWVIWMGVSLAIRRGAVTVITLISHRGPLWWQYSVRTFAGLSLALLLAYACVRSTQFALGDLSHNGRPASVDFAWFYPIVSMAIGYYFISLHYLQGVLSGAAELLEREAPGRALAVGAAGGFTIGAIVWLAAFWALEAGASPLVAVMIIFVALTMAGTPIVFMLSIVGIIAMWAPNFLGLALYPTPGALTPFSTAQNQIGLERGGELLVILMFLIVAEVMNASGMSARLIAVAAAVVGHFRGGMAYVAQATSLIVSGISGSAQADAAIMTPLLVPAMEREGYRRDVAAAVVAGASIKGPIGPLSIMFIVYGSVVQGPGSASVTQLLLSGLLAIIVLFIFQSLTVYAVVRRMDFLEKRPFAGIGAIGQTTRSALPVLAIPVIILGGIFSGVFTPTESASVGAVVTIAIALFWYRGISPGQLPGILTIAGLETGIVLLLLADSAILGKALKIDGFGRDLEVFLTDLTDNKYVFLLVVNLLLLGIGIFVEPLPAILILAPFLAPVAFEYGIDPVHFGLIMVFNLVLALIHPPIGLVIFLVSSLAKVSVERLSLMILPWLGVSLFVLFLITYLPSDVVLWLSNLLQ